MSRSLGKKCLLFNKLATHLFIVKNNDPILSKLSETDSFDKRVAIASDEFDKIGEGSSRIVFQLSEDLVIKIAKNPKGLAQNKEETKPELQTKITNHVLASDSEGKWIIQRFAEKLNKKRFEEISGVDFDDLGESLHYKFNNDSDDYKKPKTYDQIIESPIFNELMGLIIKNDLQIGDLSRIESWGEIDESPVIMDYGLSRDIYDKFYD